LNVHNHILCFYSKRLNFFLCSLGGPRPPSPPPSGYALTVHTVLQQRPQDDLYAMITSSTALCNVLVFVQ